MNLRKRIALALLLPMLTTALVAVAAYWALSPGIDASESVRAVSAAQNTWVWPRRPRSSARR